MEKKNVWGKYIFSFFVVRFLYGDDIIFLKEMLKYYIDIWIYLFRYLNVRF